MTELDDWKRDTGGDRGELQAIDHPGHVCEHDGASGGAYDRFSRRSCVHTQDVQECVCRDGRMTRRRERVVVAERRANGSFRGGVVHVLHRDSCEFRVPRIGVFGGGGIFVVCVASSAKWEEGIAFGGEEIEQEEEFVRIVREEEFAEFDHLCVGDCIGRNWSEFGCVFISGFGRSGGKSRVWNSCISPLVGLFV